MVELCFDYERGINIGFTTLLFNFISMLFQCFNHISAVKISHMPAGKSFLAGLARMWCKVWCRGHAMIHKGRASVPVKTCFLVKWQSNPITASSPGIFNDPNLILAEVKAAPDTWCCVCMSVLKESGEYLSLLGMPVIWNAFEWCFFVLVWMEFFIHLFTSRQRRYLSYYISLSKANLC